MLGFENLQGLELSHRLQCFVVLVDEQLIFGGLQPGLVRLGDGVVHLVGAVAAHCRLRLHLCQALLRRTWHPEARLKRP